MKKALILIACLLFNDVVMIGHAGCHISACNDRKPRVITKLDICYASVTLVFFVYAGYTIFNDLYSEYKKDVESYKARLQRKHEQKILELRKHLVKELVLTRKISSLMSLDDMDLEFDALREKKSQDDLAKKHAAKMRFESQECKDSCCKVDMFFCAPVTKKVKKKSSSVPLFEG